MERKKIFRLTIWMLLLGGCGRPLELQEPASFAERVTAATATSGPRGLSRESHRRPPPETKPEEKPEATPANTGPEQPREEPPVSTEPSTPEPVAEAPPRRPPVTAPARPPKKTDPKPVAEPPRAPPETAPQAKAEPQATAEPEAKPEPQAEVPVPRPKPRPTPPPPEGLRLAEINWKSPGRPTLNGKPAPLGLLPYWHEYPWRKVSGPEKWTAWLLEEFSAQKVFTEGSPRDVARYCPRYSSLNGDERKLFWLRFFSVLAEMESAFNPAIVVHDVKVGPNIYSSGLLQLSLESAKYRPYGCTMIKQQSDLVDARKNLACGVRILGYFLRKDGLAAGYMDRGSYWLGGSRYWAPLRHTHLRSAGGRAKLDGWISNSRPGWIKAGLAPRHPAYEDAGRRAKGEKNLEKLLRLMNGMPICH